MRFYLSGLGVVMTLALFILLLAWVGVVNLPLFYPLSCSTADKKVGTTVRKVESGYPAPRLYCRAD